MDRLPPGLVVDEVVLPVERGKIRELARATGTADPVHVDREAAEAAGFPDVAAPLTYSATAAHLRDQAAFTRALGLDVRRVVVGSVSWEHLRPVVAGEELRAVRRVEGDETRTGRSGPMRLVVLVTDFTDERGERVLVQRETLIERGAPS